MDIKCTVDDKYWRRIEAHVCKSVKVVMFALRHKMESVQNVIFSLIRHIKFSYNLLSWIFSIESTFLFKIKIILINKILIYYSYCDVFNLKFCSSRFFFKCCGLDGKLAISADCSAWHQPNDNSEQRNV